MRSKFALTFFSLSLFLLSASPAALLAQQQPYQPSVGQEGKDVIWVPTPEALVQRMLEMAKLTANDFLMDLGSGDGRIVIAAAKLGARARGIEYNPDMVEHARRNAVKEGVSDKAAFEKADIFETDFSRATVVTMYLLPELNLRLRPKILELKPGTRIVSHAFDMDEWEADETRTEDGRTAYLWIVPAKVEGSWNWDAQGHPAELALKQTFQKIEGSLKVDGKELPLQDGKLEGDQISFHAGGNGPGAWDFKGRVNGKAIEGSVKHGGEAAAKWTAARRAG